MAKAGPKPKARAAPTAAGSRPGDSTRERIVAAAVETLKEKGFGGASARAIADRGGFNQALVFYHFGTVNDLLLAALDRTSRDRMSRYREAVRGVSELPDLMRVAAAIYREDLAAGHIKVLAELLAASSSVPDLGPAIVERMEPWVRFAEEAIRPMVEGSLLEQLLPVSDMAYLIVALYLGVELLEHLDPERERAEHLLLAAARLAPIAAVLLGAVKGGS